MGFQDPTHNNIREIVSEKDWRPEEIGFFDPDCEEAGPVITINRHIYYRDVYAFINRLKNIALSQSVEKTRAILPQILREVP